MGKTGYIKHLNCSAGKDENKYSNWYMRLLDYCMEKDGDCEEFDKYNQNFVREYYALGMSPEQAYRGLKSDLLIEEEEDIL